MLIAKMEKNTFWGFLAIGFVALAGGIMMFLTVVPNWDNSIPKPPIQMSLLFTKIYSIQANLRSAGQPFSPDLRALGVDVRECEELLCQFRLIDGGKNYDLRMSKDGKTWRITANSMVPEQVTESK